MKNIVRWTIGNVSSEGFECLEKSVSNFIKLYGDQFDYFICYNNIKEEKLKWSRDLKINLINQHDHIDSINITPVGHNPCWKLYPPRINKNAYEIFIDNDLILHKKINLDKFIEKNVFFITQALKKNYGSLDEKITSDNYYNTGFFGLPKNFDFKKHINKLIKKYKIDLNSDHFEEQGVVAHIFHKNNPEIILLGDIYVSFEDYQMGKYGLHFVGLNTDIQRFWYFYNTKFL